MNSVWVLLGTTGGKPWVKVYRAYKDALAERYAMALEELERKEVDTEPMEPTEVIAAAETLVNGFPVLEPETIN